MFITGERAPTAVLRFSCTRSDSVDLPLSVRSLTGEASTSMVPSTTVTIALSTTFVQASTIPPVPSTEVHPSLENKKR
ncbi:hypothetical protein Tco_0193740 [Tanacetum coccineum]